MMLTGDWIVLFCLSTFRQVSTKFSEKYCTYFRKMQPPTEFNQSLPDWRLYKNSPYIYHTMVADAWRILSLNQFTWKTHDPSKCVNLLDWAMGLYSFLLWHITKDKRRKAMKFLVDQIIAWIYEELNNFSNLQKSPKENSQQQEVDFTEFAKL